jgi:hypothetical protein
MHAGIQEGLLMQKLRCNSTCPERATDEGVSMAKPLPMIPYTDISTFQNQFFDIRNLSVLASLV